MNSTHRGMVHSIKLSFNVIMKLRQVEPESNCWNQLALVFCQLSERGPDTLRYSASWAGYRWDVTTGGDYIAILYRTNVCWYNSLCVPLAVLSVRYNSWDSLRYHSDDYWFSKQIVNVWFIPRLYLYIH